MEGLTSYSGGGPMDFIRAHMMIVAVVIVLIVLLVWYMYFYESEGMRGLPRSAPIMGATTGASGMRFQEKDDAYQTVAGLQSRSSIQQQANANASSGFESMAGNPRDAGGWSDLALMQKAITGN